MLHQQATWQLLRLDRADVAMQSVHTCIQMPCIAGGLSSLLS